ncbi:MAG: hypothetical protein GKR77_07585 [Legionellales bacterium]|nr:hypothetical protein [Legionellales bacterium]
MSVVLTLTAPAKTFLIGEYLALTGGPTLILTTAPPFKLTVSQPGRAVSHLHPHSPAGRLLQAHPQLADTYHFEFHDPYQQQGGLGASSAQFLLVYQALHQLAQTPLISWQQSTIETLLTCYQTHSWSGQGLPPSGADLVAQAIGGVCHFTRKPFALTQYTWPFPQMDGTVVHTRHKLATHQHLMNHPSSPNKTLLTLAQQAVAAFQQPCALTFAQTLQAYGDCLANYDLVTDASRNWLATIQTLTGVLASKGCGALGADTLFILTEADATTTVRQWLIQHQLPVIATTEQITTGLA